MEDNKQITLIVTSCNRHDLLKITLDTLFNVNAYPLHKILLHADGNHSTNDFISDNYGLLVKVITSEKRIGLSKSLDLLLSNVETEYFMSFEDDWITYKNPFFINQSLKILEARPDIHQVWIRDHNDHNHPLGEVTEIAGVKVREVKHGYLDHWNGFSFNPSLRRMSDYHRMFPNGFSEFKEEIECAKHVQKFNYKAVALEESVVKHIGWGRHTENFQH